MNTIRSERKNSERAHSEEQRMVVTRLPCFLDYMVEILASRWMA